MGKIQYYGKMSNSQSTHLATSVKSSSMKSKYLELISNGFTEAKALTELSFPRGEYLRYLNEDKDFALQVEAARKLRAEFWVDKIASSVDEVYDKEELPSERLRFDKLQFLAKADNPDKYGSNSKKVDINIDLKQFKLLPPEEAVKALANDPFAIEANFTPIMEDLL